MVKDLQQEAAMRRKWQQELAAMKGTLTREQADRRNMLMQLLGYKIPSYMLYVGLPETALFHVKEAIWRCMDATTVDENTSALLAAFANAIEQELHEE